MTTRADRVAALLERHGQTYCAELGINIGRNTPSPLFRWLTAAILFSARISAEQATKAARALADAGWTTAHHMNESTWEERVKVLNTHGYARYDESTARMLGEDCTMLLHRYGGDLRKLREEAGEDPGKERTALKAFKGLGDVGVDIFFREVQGAWPELYPFADKKALSAAKELDLGDDAAALSKLVAQDELPRLMTALVRASLAKDLDAIRSAA